METTIHTIAASELLEMFATQDDIRPQLCKPWREGHHVFATNSHWAIRLPLDRVERPELVQNAAGLRLADRFSSADWSHLQTMERVDHTACDACAGTGRIFRDTCQSCNGEGAFTHCGIEYACRLCHGFGHSEHTGTKAHPANTQCHHCSGTGFELNGLVMHITPFRGAWFQKAYLARLSRLPGIQFGIRPTTPYDPEVVATFRFDGGDGLLMPCRAPRKSEA